MIDMDVGLKNLPLRTDPWESAPLWVSLVAITLVFLVFVGDWFTPATVVVGMAYQAPIVFAGLKGTPLLTMQVTLLGMIAIALGWFMDFSADSFHFSSDRIENRLLSLLSLLIVSCLTLRAERNSARLPL